MIPNKNEEDVASHFYHWASEANIHIQHILYNLNDIEYYLHLNERNVIPSNPSAILFVLGRYSEKLIANSKDLDQALSHLKKLSLPWFCCAFGPKENACLNKAIKNGGHARVGFENNFFLADGTMAAGTYETVRETAQTIRSLNLEIADRENTKKILFKT